MTEGDDFACLACHATQTTRRGAGTDKGVGVDRKLLHARLVAEDGAARAFAAGVDGQDGNLVIMSGKHLPQRLDGGALAGTGDAGDAQAHTLAAVRQATLDDLLGLFLVLETRTFHQCDGTAEEGAVAMQDAAHQLLYRGFLTAQGSHALHIAAAHLVGLLHAGGDAQRRVVFKVAVKMFIVHSNSITQQPPDYCGGETKKKRLTRGESLFLVAGIRLELMTSGL